MGKDIIDVTLNRENSGEPWGFRLAGGKDQGQPLTISQVTKSSLTQKAGLLANDFLMSIAGQDVYGMTHEQAEQCIHAAGDRFTMVIERVNFKKFEKKSVDFSASKTLEDGHSKANLQKDWNTPWVSKDGSRLKQAVRYVEEPTAPAKTSQQHYYSTPGSILAPEPQISKEELEALIREHGQDSRPGSRAQQASTQSKYQEDPAVEKERERFQPEETYCREREEDSQAPPDLEPVSLGYEQFQQPAMVGYGEEALTGGYEPSADELIEVLKNLENLAAADPTLYRTIVDQIKGGPLGMFHCGLPSTNGQVTDYEHQLFEQQREAEIYRQQQQQQLEMQRQQQQLYEEQTRLMQMQEESLKLETMEEVAVSTSRVERETVRQEQQVSRETLVDTRQRNTGETHIPITASPKEITVIAGDGKAVKVQLGAEIAQEDSRRQVAEAAGLKHVPLPDFDNTENSAWAGSLKKTERNKFKAQDCDDENPWAGSLRHVVDVRKDKTRKDGTEEKEGGSNAPWMGTLRHVVHDNKVTKHYGVNQFQSKRYPDEDAGNPFEGTGGTHSRPHCPLTPAAIINGSVMSRDEMAKKEEEEEVERIRSNLGSMTVSTALMQALMPKLLKMHEQKYEPMDKVDAQAIMEGILGMQAGLNPDQQADANEEAEMIIRAIMQEEIDKSIYSKMADDLETAKKRMNKKKTKKVPTQSVGLTA